MARLRHAVPAQGLALYRQDAAGSLTCFLHGRIRAGRSIDDDDHAPPLRVDRSSHPTGDLELVPRNNRDRDASRQRKVPQRRLESQSHTPLERSIGRRRGPLGEKLLLQSPSQVLGQRHSWSRPSPHAGGNPRRDLGEQIDTNPLAGGSTVQARRARRDQKNHQRQRGATRLYGGKLPHSFRCGANALQP